MKLPESDVKKWKRQSTNPEAILVPRLLILIQVNHCMSIVREVM